MGTPRPDWELPVRACQAVGGDVEEAVSASAALGCMQISIILVDDMLDQDPRGEYRRQGHAHTANMALALQAAAFNILTESVTDLQRLALAQGVLARLALHTAAGQELDTMDLPLTEETYWRIVAAKSTPFYASGLMLGAILGGANRETQTAFYELGCKLGEIIQIHDDLADAFAVPANPDWLAGRHNLAILFASLAEYPEQARFLSLVSNVHQPVSLAEAQRILVTSGALSYCIYQIHSRYEQSQAVLAELPVANPAPLRDTFERQILPVLNLLREFNIPIPAQLAHVKQ